VAPRKWAPLQQATITIEDAAGERTTQASTVSPRIYFFATRDADACDIQKMKVSG
jgi:hypothetical protein